MSAQEDRGDSLGPRPPYLGLSGAAGNLPFSLLLLRRGGAALAAAAVLFVAGPTGL